MMAALLVTIGGIRRSLLSLLVRRAPVVVQWRFRIRLDGREELHIATARRRLRPGPLLLDVKGLLVRLWVGVRLRLMRFCLGVRRRLVRGLSRAGRMRPGCVVRRDRTAAGVTSRFRAG